MKNSSKLLLAAAAIGGVIAYRRRKAAANAALRAQAAAAAQALVPRSDIEDMQLSEPSGTAVPYAGVLTGTGFDRHSLRSYGKGSLGH